MSKKRISIYLSDECFDKLQDIYSFRRKREGSCITYSQIVEESIDVSHENIFNSQGDAGSNDMPEGSI